LKIIALIAACLLAALVLFSTVDAVRQNLAFKRAAVIHIGDSKKRVRQVLGKPSDVVFSLFSGNEIWAYGGHVDWPNLTTSPMRFRFFGPDSDEVSVRFDSYGKVDRITIPKLF